MKNSRWIIIGIVVVGVLFFLLRPSVDGPENQGPVRIAMPPWTTSPPPTYVAKVMLEDVLGLDVEIQEVDIGVAFQALTTDDFDLLVDAWMPNLHANYFEAHGDKLALIGGPLYSGTELGWAVPAYVPVNSVSELNDYVEEFQGRVIGIDPGAGMQQTSEAIIEAYDLDYELTEGSEFAMLAALADAYRAEEWVVFIAWRPHFKFAQYDLKMLEEEKGYWAEDSVVKVGSLSFEERFPEAARLIANWEIDLSDIEVMINEIEVNERDPEVVAREWVEANRDLIDQWLGR